MKKLSESEEQLWWWTQQWPKEERSNILHSICSSFRVLAVHRQRDGQSDRHARQCECVIEWAVQAAQIWGMTVHGLGWLGLTQESHQWKINLFHSLPPLRQNCEGSFNQSWWQSTHPHGFPKSLNKLHSHKGFYLEESPMATIWQN